MLTTFLLASTLPLVSIEADDTRLDRRRTFVSEQAGLVLSGDADGDVLCLDRARATYTQSICLDRSEWLEAVEIARTNPPKSRRSGFVYNNSHSSFGSTSKYGLGSSPSTFSSRH
ncbi:hypothetical protein [Erythrobacter litoralis]|uniref:Uncharacterized protein n=1 Tax=Erythrobacter litoralis (strain HTCC2594) TaxID=314225 RepID=Q2NAS5_ERYLH|nr:hypothetical protein [Erythrobacter litoralis]ABC63216.1 hypothetical protein ELI_05620 [Erythrobacter litoralis HTCC2594]